MRGLPSSVSPCLLFVEAGLEVCLGWEGWTGRSQQELLGGDTVVPFHFPQ